jgi:hypothetical protein
MKNHVMVDLETYDTKPTSLVLSIGAVRFDPMNLSGPSEPFYVVLNHEQQIERGRTVSERTLDWWAKQSAEAQEVLQAPRMDVSQGLEFFADFVNKEPDTCVWGNGADFDNVILASLYNSFGMQQPWKYSNSRCYRTLRGFALPYDYFEKEREGVHHNALDDAIYQAMEMRRRIDALGLRFP